MVMLMISASFPALIFANEGGNVQIAQLKQAMIDAEQSMKDAKAEMDTAEETLNRLNQNGKAKKLKLTRLMTQLRLPRLHSAMQSRQLMTHSSKENILLRRPMMMQCLNITLQSRPTMKLSRQQKTNNQS